MNTNRTVTALVLSVLAVVTFVIWAEVTEKPMVEPRYTPPTAPFTTVPNTVPPGIDPNVPISGLPELNIQPTTTTTTATIRVNATGRRSPTTTIDIDIPPVTTPPITIPRPDILPPIETDGITDTLCNAFPAVCGLGEVLDTTVNGVSDIL